MRSTKARLRIAQLAGILVVAAVASSLVHLMDEKQLTVFDVQSSFSVPITERDGKDYVAVADVLDKLGTIEISPSGNDGLKLRFNSLEAELQNRESVVEINGSSVKTGKVLIENGRPLVPLEGIPALLQHFLSKSVTYRAESRRLFLGDSGIRFALELKKGDGTQLILSFSTPVSPQIHTKPGKLNVVFASDALVMETQRWQFDDDVITSAEYHDAAEPELRISSTEPLLASFADNGKTIVITPAPSLTANAPSSTTPDAPSVDSQRTEEAPAVSTITAASPTAPIVPATEERYLVVIDASHGGRERGAALSDKLAEKDVTLALARSLRKQLTERGMSSLMIRDADSTLTPDQRAGMANTSQAAVYLAIHAGGLQRGVRVYTSMLTTDDATRGPYVSWEKAQAGFVRSSRLVASSILDELGKSHVRVPPALLPAPVRPLNNVAAAAVAIEVGPLSDDMATVSNPDYQEVVAKALASALVTVRPKVERAR
jgi:N-acetylmuramoyl-L-alanine amidase